MHSNSDSVIEDVVDTVARELNSDPIELDPIGAHLESIGRLVTDDRKAEVRTTIHGVDLVISHDGVAAPA